MASCIRETGCYMFGSDGAAAVRHQREYHTLYLEASVRDVVIAIWEKLGYHENIPAAGGEKSSSVRLEQELAHIYMDIPRDLRHR